MDEVLQTSHTETIKANKDAERVVDGCSAKRLMCIFIRGGRISNWLLKRGRKPLFIHFTAKWNSVDGSFFSCYIIWTLTFNLTVFDTFSPFFSH